MRILHIGCGANRIQEDGWVNLDNLQAVLLPGTPERSNLDAEPNYVNHDLISGPLPFNEDTFDVVVTSHVIEHFDCMEATDIMRECFRVLRPSGEMIISVPDASYFRTVFSEDTIDNAVRLFGEPIHLPDGETTFTGYALWNRFHKAILTEDAVWHYFARVGFINVSKYNVPSLEVRKALNRFEFSLIMRGIKP